MSEQDNPTPPAGGPVENKTFSQADVDRIVNERLKRERDKNAEKYGDYDELKAKAQAADTSKSEMTKLAEWLAASEKKTADMEARALRMEVAQAKGLTAAQAKRLSGSTKEELEADADELLETFGSSKKDEPKPEEAKDDKPAEEASPFGRPKERLTSGAAPAAEPEKSPEELADEVRKRTRGI